MASADSQQPLWEPPPEQREKVEMGRFMDWAGERRGRPFADYEELWRWSVDELEEFWASIWEFCGVRASKPYERVLASLEMPGTRWFEGAELNYAENMLARAAERGDEVAVLHCSELRPELGELTWGELRAQVAAAAGGLRALGVGRGDRVVAYMPNIPETLIAFLAVASIGAIWSSAAPEFGARSVIDRFAQIEPKVLLAVDGYRHGGKDFDRTENVQRIVAELPTVEHVVTLPYLADEDVHEPASGGGGVRSVLTWDELLSRGEGSVAALRAGPVRAPAVGAVLVGHDGPAEGDRAGPRRHPGGAAEEAHAPGPARGRPHVLVHDDGLDDVELPGRLPAQRRGDRAVRRQPRAPGPGRAVGASRSATGMTCMGVSAGLLASTEKAGVQPGRDYDLSALRAIGSTGSPLAPESFRWVYERVKGDVWLFSTSGGTDVCTAFVAGCPLLPVYEGELQCRALGCAVEAWDEQGNSLVDEVGELVVREPMPSMPLFLWGDADGSRLRESYFAMYPGVWRHGDWIRITPRGGAVIYGRSDSTINRQGVRMGTSEIYRAALGVPEVLDALVVDIPGRDASGEPGGELSMILFVVLREGIVLDDDLAATIKRRIREDCSPRHVPNEVRQIAEVPRTLSGKVLEVPVKRILMGTRPEQAASVESLANPHSLDYFVDLARELA